MTIDTDIQAIAEYNANASDMNTKINQFYPLISGTLGQLENNGKIVVRRSGSWSCEDTVIYDGLYQNFGSVSGSTDLLLNNNSSRSAIFFTITGETLVNGFGDNLLAGVPYTMFISQNSVGGHKVRWPGGSSIVGDLDQTPNSITVVVMMKLPDGKLMIKNHAYLQTAEIGDFQFRAVDDFSECYKTKTDLSGNILTNDWGNTLSVTKINGDVSKVSVPVAGSSGGVFTVNSSGVWSFTTNGEFGSLSENNFINTSVVCTVTNGEEETTSVLSVKVVDYAELDYDGGGWTLLTEEHIISGIAAYSYDPVTREFSQKAETPGFGSSIHFGSNIFLRSDVPFTEIRVFHSGGSGYTCAGVPWDNHIYAGDDSFIIDTAEDYYYPGWRPTSTDLIIESNILLDGWSIKNLSSPGRRISLGTGGYTSCTRVTMKNIVMVR